MVPRTALFVLLTANFMFGDAEVFEVKHKALQLGGHFNRTFNLNLHDISSVIISEVTLCQILATSNSTAEVRATKLISGDHNPQANETVPYASAGNLSWKLDIVIENATLEDTYLLYCKVNSNNETRQIVVLMEIVAPIGSVLWYEQVFTLTALVAISCVGLSLLALLGIQLGALWSYTMGKMDKKEGRRNYLFERTTPFDLTVHGGNEETTST